MPRHVDPCRNRSDKLELIDAVAAKVDGRDPETPQHIESGRIEMRVVEVTQKPIDGAGANGRRDLRENSLGGARAHCEFLGRKVAGDIHEAAGLTEVGL